MKWKVKRGVRTNWPTEDDLAIFILDKADLKTILEMDMVTA